MAALEWQLCKFSNLMEGIDYSGFDKPRSISWKHVPQPAGEGLLLLSVQIFVRVKTGHIEPTAIRLIRTAQTTSHGDR